MKKITLLTLATFCTLAANAIIIIPMPTGGGGGDLQPKQIIALWIALNIPSIIILIVRTFMWLFSEKYETLLEYVFTEYDVAVINTMWLICLNGLAAVIAIAIYISEKL